jgi:transcription initiation factor TFIIIB Brf1 subunit/transcription initiation factor TFIIB
MVKCPKCQSKNVGQYRSPVGPIWCRDCGYRVEQKELDKSFFVDISLSSPVKTYTLFVNGEESGSTKDREQIIKMIGHKIKGTYVKEISIKVNHEHKN